MEKVTLYNNKGFPIDIQNIKSTHKNYIVLMNDEKYFFNEQGYFISHNIRLYQEDDLNKIEQSVGFSLEKINHNPESVNIINTEEWNEFNLDILQKWLPNMNGYTAYTYLMVRFGEGKCLHMGGFGPSWILTTGHPDIFIFLNPSPNFKIWENIRILTKKERTNLIDVVNPYIRHTFLSLKKSIYIDDHFNIEGTL